MCVSLSLILRAVFFDQYARFLRPIGDEHFYWTRALDLLVLLENLGSPSHPDAIAALDHVIDRGWFLPGLSIILSPVRALALETEMARLYVGGINFFLYALNKVVGNLLHRDGKHCPVLGQCAQHRNVTGDQWVYQIFSGLPLPVLGDAVDNHADQPVSKWLYGAENGAGVQGVGVPE